MQSKWEDETEEEGFLGDLYAAARHIVPVRASDALISISNSISLYPYPDRFNTACFEVGQIMRGEAAGYVRIFWIYNTAYINRSKNV